MNQGVELMLSHMKTNPDAFRKGRWRNLIARVIREDGEIFVDGEAEAVKNAVVELEQVLFNADVVEALASKPEPPPGYTITAGHQIQEVYEGASLLDVVRHVEEQKRARERERGTQVSALTGAIGCTTLSNYYVKN